MRCNNCGSEVKSGSKFCSKCGMPITSTETQDIETSTKPNRPKWWFYVIVAVAAAAVIISFIFWARSTGRLNLNRVVTEKVDDNEDTSEKFINNDSEDTIEVSDSTDREDIPGVSDSTESEDATEVSGSTESEDATEVSGSTESEDATEVSGSTESEDATEISGSTESEKITVASVSATSQLDDYQGKTYSPYNLFDGDLETAYVEGVSGVGKGEEITIALNGEYEIDEIVWYPGYQISEDLLAKNGYPTEVTFYFSNGISVVSTVNGSLHIGTSVTVPVDGEEVTDSITVVINEAVAGYKYDDTCISEIELYGRKVS